MKTRSRRRIQLVIFLGAIVLMVMIVTPKIVEARRDAAIIQKATNVAASASSRRQAKIHVADKAQLIKHGGYKFVPAVGDVTRSIVYLYPIAGHQNKPPREVVGQVALDAIDHFGSTGGARVFISRQYIGGVGDCWVIYGDGGEPEMRWLKSPAK